jgi:transcriptional regulator with XRE-family HTH domain
MFYSYNSHAYGDILKELRENLKLSQTDVSKITRISADALRRIENGYVTPKIETLVRLSLIYKINLIQLYAEISKVPDLISLYSEVSLCIKNSDVAGLKLLKAQVDHLKSDLYKNGIILIEDYLQFQFFCDASIAFIHNESMQDAMKKTIDALRITHASFTLEKLEQFQYNDFEIRILHLLAITYNRSKNHSETIRLISFILTAAEPKFINEETIRNTCLLYFTLSYAYNELSDYENCLLYADQGIAYSVKNNRYKELHLLYYRKGIAEYLLEMPDYLSSLNKSIMLLEISGNTQLMNTYRKITLEKYGIQL